LICDNHSSGDELFDEADVSDGNADQGGIAGAVFGPIMRVFNRQLRRNKQTEKIHHCGLDPEWMEDPCLLTT